jgi:hypothetical protein
MVRSRQLEGSWLMMKVFWFLDNLRDMLSIAQSSPRKTSRRIRTVVVSAFLSLTLLY